MKDDQGLARASRLYGHHRLRLSVHALPFRHVLALGCTRHLRHLSTMLGADGGPIGGDSDWRSRELDARLIHRICRWWRRHCGNVLPLHGGHVWLDHLHPLELAG